MPNQRRPRNDAENPNPELSQPQVTEGDQWRVRRPQVGSVQGGAPKVTEDTVSQRVASAQPPAWSNTRSNLASVPMVSSPWSLKDIATTHAPMVEKLRDSLTAKLTSLPVEQQGSRFWQGVREYPAEMAQMIIRRVLTNRLHTQVMNTPISQWMSWLEG